jgi:hypothetical protein
MKHMKLLGSDPRPPSGEDGPTANSQRLGNFLFRQGKRPANKLTPWTTKRLEWIKGRFQHLALDKTGVVVATFETNPSSSNALSLRHPVNDV